MLVGREREIEKVLIPLRSLPPNQEFIQKTIFYPLIVHKEFKSYIQIPLLLVVLVNRRGQFH